MKKVVGITATSIIVIFVAFYLLNRNSSTTFNEAVLETQDITSIEIIKSSTNEEPVIDKRNDVKQLLNYFSEAELKKDKIGSIDFIESYWLTLSTDGKRMLGITIYDDQYVMVFNYSTKNQTSYRIINGFNSTTLEQYFE